MMTMVLFWWKNYDKSRLYFFNETHNRDFYFEMRSNLLFLMKCYLFPNRSVMI